MYHLKVPKKMKIGENDPNSIAFKLKIGLARDNLFVSSASRICELKNLALDFFKFAFEMKLCWKTHPHVIFGPFSAQNGE